jgi:hypothetical protein
MLVFVGLEEGVGSRDGVGLVQATRTRIRAVRDVV